MLSYATTTGKEHKNSLLKRSKNKDRETIIHKGSRSEGGETTEEKHSDMTKKGNQPGE